MPDNPERHFPYQNCANICPLGNFVVRETLKGARPPENTEVSKISVNWCTPHRHRVTFHMTIFYWNSINDTSSSEEVTRVYHGKCNQFRSQRRLKP